MKFDLFVSKERHLGNAFLMNSFECEDEKKAFEIAEEFLCDTMITLYEEEMGDEFDEFDFIVFVEENEMDYYLRSGKLIFKNFVSKSNGLRELVFGS